MAGDSWGDCAVPMIQDSCHSRFESGGEKSVLRLLLILPVQSMAMRSTLGHANGTVGRSNLQSTTAAATMIDAVVLVVVVAETVAE